LHAGHWRHGHYATASGLAGRTLGIIGLGPVGQEVARRGLAFGMHVILGSQTLGGAYALPRTTMGQMGVRIALQCNEADAALILSDDNTAARLLSRPGEAIYNDAGGMIEGNSPFQVVWLGDHEREQRVRQLAQRGAPSAGTRPAPIVFDGTSKASIAACRPLRERMRAGGVAADHRAGRCAQR
jgi:hypothetical protein